MNTVGLVNFPSALFWTLQTHPTTIHAPIKWFFWIITTVFTNRVVFELFSFLCPHLLPLLFKFLNKCWHSQTAQHYYISQKMNNSQFLCSSWSSASVRGSEQGWGTSLPTNAASHFHSHTNLTTHTFLRHEKYLRSFSPNNKEQLCYIFQFSVLIKVYTVLATLQKHN